MATENIKDVSLVFINSYFTKHSLVIWQYRILGLDFTF